MLPHAKEQEAKWAHEHASKRAIATPSTPQLPGGATYTCPMHPQIRQAQPGSCPICGMALEPVTSAEDTGPSPELIDMTRRF